MKTPRTAVIITLAAIAIAILLGISIIDNEQLNTVTKNFLEYFNLAVTPICLILGIIIGYPLIKRKLAEDCISRQFEIMHKANGELRKLCLTTMEKYPDKYISSPLQKEEIQKCINDVESISQCAFDANPDAHRYAKLLEKTLKTFFRKYPEEGDPQYYLESLHSFVHTHAGQVYNYAKTLGSDFDGRIVRKRRLIRKLDGFVFDNRYTDIETIDNSIDYYHTSQLLVIFFGNSIHSAPYDNPLYHLAGYGSAPSPCPMARLMYAKEIYFPPVLKSNQQIIFGLEMKLHLIGFSARESVKTNGEKSKYHICHYANISNVGFVKGTLTKDSLNDFQDDYLCCGSMKDYEISDLEIDEKNEMISFRIDNSLLKSMFRKNRTGLARKMKSEMKNMK